MWRGWPQTEAPEGAAALHMPSKADKARQQQQATRLLLLGKEATQKRGHSSSLSGGSPQGSSIFCIMLYFTRPMDSFSAMAK
mmetsp:Transcript_141/g.516  ORF Transcript_141/g.516 Transcript_141/m.516 type:complete len:82 (+) Transcript_141:67-312(+)|eukprot:CAMPEP_0117664284 /NCGR_PEP_ID=MMETSP0804-20121206/9127_1 /TAXON_ID=1074897 /ORGANISM="Tetraselmis astigmatica, Strain CCMP880" /LENGTH=81 /DNA_ID=CAMNT_0005471485 /DNA_START=40 /DNA_END=285 /DNA_ORIENTATION=+